MAWQAVYDEAESLCRDGDCIEAVQKLNGCMELFETYLGGTGSQILKEPKAFIEEFAPKMSPEQKSAAFKMFMCRGDLLVGIGARKRAATEYSCAEALHPDDEAPKLKRSKLKEPATFNQNDKKVPCTILAGFLGSGKTTLLNHILETHHGKRIAVIENEFGEVGIYSDLVKGGSMAEEECLVEITRGIICCTVRGDLIAGLKKLIKVSNKAGKPLDGVLIETTGLADLAPVAQTFVADDFVQRHMRLDGILTLIDAKHISQHLDDKKPIGVVNEAVEQIAFADRVLLNKCDLVDSESELLDVEKRIRAINQTVPIKRTVNSEVEMDFILGIRGFSLDKIVEMDHAFLGEGDEHQLWQQHASGVSSVVIDVPGEVMQQKLSAWLEWLLREKGVDLFRSKGVLAVQGIKHKLVFQTIHTIFANSHEGSWAPGEERRCRMAFIGKNLKREELTTGFTACMAN